MLRVMTFDRGTAAGEAGGWHKTHLLWPLKLSWAEEERDVLKTITLGNQKRDVLDL